ncbi:acyl-CoA carboxylase epsilon subunit [Lysinimonas soli]|uniref:Acyl-CoA carboxylase epsilon subunit n=1 Tax=Lysinimonas soli TaxID=1074233 RepID=A0ABW0NV67_9MICO
MTAADGGPHQAYDIHISGGSPTPEEIAAVTAVLTAALEELAGESRRRQRLAPTAWERSQRAVRTPLGPGTWATFGR